MRVVIIGGTGNISVSIVKLLLQQGHDVTCYNRGKSSGLPQGARLIVGDRENRAEYETTMQREKFDVAIDMICFNREDAESNLKAFREVGQFIQTSTVMTYGLQNDWLPISEDHPLRPHTPYGVGKVEADAVYLRAYYETGFPVTIIKPSTTNGPKRGLIRQVAWDFVWIDRIRKGKPILICGDGEALHQIMHVDDAAPGFGGVIGKQHCIGQVYNLVDRGFITWGEFHRTANKVIGCDVELVGITLADLRAVNAPNSGICEDVFAHNTIYSAEKIFRDVPEFRPRMTLEEGIRDILAAMDAEGRIPNSDEVTWEDKLIAAQRTVRQVKL